MRSAALGPRVVAAPDVQRRVGDPPTRRQELDHREDHRAAERVHAPDHVREDAHGEHDRRPAAVFALPDGTGEQPEEKHGQRQAERIGVLPGQRREQVPPVDGEGVVEQERQGGGGEDGRQRGPEPEETAAGPGADGQDDRPEDGPQLEGDTIGDDPAADRNEEVGNREVEGVQGEAVVPARIPAREVAVHQQALEELGHRDVRARVTTCGRRVCQQHARVQLRQRDDDHTGDGDHRDGARHPPPGAAGRGLGHRHGGTGFRGCLLHHGLGPKGFSHVQPGASRRGPR